MKTMTQESILQGIQKHFAKNKDKKLEEMPYVNTAEFNGAPCAYFDGIYDYFHLND